MYEPVPVHLAVEDELSETVLRVILKQSGRIYCVGSCFRRGGYGYLKKRIIAFNNAAKHLPFVVLTDQDVAECAPKLVRDWLPHPKQHNLVFRVAVREVESWVIADRSAFATFLGISKSKVPEEPDQLADPKRELISLARRSRRTALRQAIVPRPGSKIGPDYNAMLGRFVKTRWNARVAMRNSPSLERAFSEIISFQPVIAKSEKSDERE